MLSSGSGRLSDFSSRATDTQDNNCELRTSQIDIDFESTIFQALVNEGKYIKVNFKYESVHSQS